MRTRELVQVCEPALKQIEDRLSTESGINVKFVTSVEQPAKPFTTYRVTLRILTFAAILFFGVAALFAF